MQKFGALGAAVVGTGFIGAVHCQTLRRLGVQVCGVLGSSAARGAAQAAGLVVGHAYASLDELLRDPQVGTVHITSPNYAHFEQVRRALLAGKHVICEKPLTLDSAQSAELLGLAQASGKVAAVCYSNRHYALNQQARGMVAAGALGDIRLVTGHYHQDWLAKPTDWNWRLEAKLGGELRSVSDIGTHWLDLVSFITGAKVEAVFAELMTFVPEREPPSGPVAVNTDDSAMIMLRLKGGARGVFSTSQVNVGRKNALHWDIAGAKASLAWDSENPEHLFVGHRDEANQTLMRDPALMNANGRAAASLPAGHVEGFADSFYALFKAVYTDILQGTRGQAATWASFADGHEEMRLCDAILKSSHEERWVKLSEI